MKASSTLVPMAVLLLWIVPGCSSPPRTDGFTSLTIAGARQAITPGAGKTRTVAWGSVDLLMVEDGPVVLTLEKLVLTLDPDPSGSGTKVTLSGTVRTRGYCTSPTWSGGVGQVVQIFFEKADNSLLVPWTVGALTVPSASAPPALSFTQTLATLQADVPVKAELVVQPALWVKCP